MWAEDVAECVLAALPGGRFASEAAGERFELAGPETMTYEEIVRGALSALHRHRPLVKLPIAFVRRFLQLTELLTGPAAFATWDEAELLELTLTSARGTADAERLGVTPRSMRSVLGAAY
jgi:NADH dehydrogenase